MPAISAPLTATSRRRALARLPALALCLLVHPAALAADFTLDTVLFGSLDAGAASFVTAGAKTALDRLDRSGFVALASIGGGRRTERACGCLPTLSRYTALGSALVGYQWVQDWGVVAAYAGPEGSVEALSDGRATAVLPARFGLRLHGEAWIRPTEETLVNATLILGSARSDAWGRLAWGYRLWGAYLGPEASLYTDHTGYRKWNLGLHATDFSVGKYAFRVSAGVQSESSERKLSPYLALSAWTPL